MFDFKYSSSQFQTHHDQRLVILIKVQFGNRILPKLSFKNLILYSSEP